MEIKNTKKICFLTQMNYESCAGSTLNAYSIARHLVKANISVSMLSYGSSYRMTSTNGVKSLNLLKRSGGPTAVLVHLLNIIVIVNYLIRGYTFIIYGVPHGRAVVLILSRILRRPIILRSTMLGDDDLYSIRANLPFTWYCLNKSRFLYWAITPEFEKIARKFSNVNTLYLTQGCRFEVSMSTRAKIINRELSYLSVGHLIFRKGFGDIVEVLSSKRINLTIVGHNDLTVPKSLFHLRNEMTLLRSKLEGRAKIVGPNENIGSFYENNDVLLHFALQEGLPNVVIEAMAHGCIPVVRRLPGIEGILIKHEINGFLFDSLHHAKEIISNIEGNKYDLRAISQAASLTIERSFSMRETAATIIKFLDDI